MKTRRQPPRSHLPIDSTLKEWHCPAKLLWYISLLSNRAKPAQLSAKPLKDPPASLFCVVGK